MAWTFEATERGYANLWRTAMLKGGADAAQAETFAGKIIAAEQRYRAVQASTGVPWYFIGALHMRESGCNFAGVLHNGDRIIGTGGLTTRVPAGRGPFATWEESAVDALKLKDMHRVQSWSVARMLFQAEVFNGVGYVSRGINSPYVWAGTNHEQLGKFTSDHNFDEDAEDTQLGVAAVLIRLAEKRPDIAADLYPATEVEPLPMSDIESADLLKEIQGLRADIAGLPAALMNALKGTTPVKPPVVEAPPVAAPAPSPVPSPVPSLSAPTSLGIVSAALAAIMQLMGVPVVGEGATAVTTAVPAVAIGSAALGLSGWGGAIVNILGTILSTFTKK